MAEALEIFKGLADGTRLRIVNELAAGDICAEDLAARLKLTPATVSFHMKKLCVAGLVAQRREKYKAVYSLRRDSLAATLSDVAINAQPKPDLSEAFRQKVIKAFMPCGYCETLPAHMKKRMVIFGEIIKKFERGKTYTEREVSETIADMHSDYCYVRRAFVGMGWMTRENGNYTVTWDGTIEEADR